MHAVRRLPPMTRSELVLDNALADDDPLDPDTESRGQVESCGSTGAYGGFTSIEHERLVPIARPDDRGLRPELAPDLARFACLGDAHYYAVLVAHHPAPLPIDRHHVTITGA